MTLKGNDSVDLLLQMAERMHAMLKFLEKIMTYGVFNDGRQVGMWQLDGIMRKLH